MLWLSQARDISDYWHAKAAKPSTPPPEWLSERQQTGEVQAMRQVQQGVGVIVVLLVGACALGGVRGGAGADGGRRIWWWCSWRRSLW